MKALWVSILTVLVVMVQWIYIGAAYRMGYNDAIKSAELITVDGAGYVIRYGHGDDFQVHEYAFEEVA